MNYYEVATSVEGTWSQATFTYETPKPLKLLSVVVVPFGTKTKLGLVVRKSTKPAFKTKSITQTLPIQLPRKTFMLLQWFCGFYGVSMSAALQHFLPNYLTTKQRNNIEIEQKPTAGTLPKLSKDQIQAIAMIEKGPGASMLHGVTGSGKTRVFVELALKTLAKGQSVLVLYPEISLSNQTIAQLRRAGPVINYHSHMTDSERRATWHAAYRSEAPAIIAGTRSSLFLPNSNIGLIIVDEAHETSLNQDSGICYNGVHVAAGLAKIHDAKLIVASATPLITDTAQIRKNGQLVCMHTKVIQAAEKPAVIIVDIKDKQHFSRNQLLSNQLITEISTSLKEKKQSLLFINRRGTAKTVICSSLSCSWQPVCERCDLPMTYHHDLYKLVCHSCGSSQPMLRACPVCESQLDLRTLGNKAIAEDLSKLFPTARIGRFDSENKKSSSFNELYESIKSGEFDILVGTQQIIKGLDLPSLRLVGILNADLSLAFPDYTSDERTFQLTTQALGRVGRGHTRNSVVVIQTFQPQSPVLRFSIEEDWHSFNELELDIRKKHRLPPFVHIATIAFKHKNEEKAFAHAAQYFEQIKVMKQIEPEGPIPCFHRKRAGFFQVQIILKSAHRTAILDAVRQASKDAVIHLDAHSLL